MESKNTLEEAAKNAKKAGVKILIWVADKKYTTVKGALRKVSKGHHYSYVTIRYISKSGKEYKTIEHALQDTFF